MFCAGRVAEEDLKRTMKACGGSIQSTCQNLQGNVLGSCEKFEEIQIGGERSVSFGKNKLPICYLKLIIWFSGHFLSNI
jgi:chaperonin GroEL (HSP60 family)